MKRDQNYINRLEKGDVVRLSNGEKVEIDSTNDFGGIRAHTVDQGPNQYVRFFDKTGKGNLGGDIETP